MDTPELPVLRPVVAVPEGMELVPRGSMALAQATPSVAEMIQEFIKSGVTESNAGALERLYDLYERVEAKKAERAFAESFVKLQAELPVIVASTQIPNRGKYERFEDVMKAIQEPLTRNGFSVSFAQESKDGRIIETCTLTHKDGHSRSNSFAVRTGGKADSETQADCKASTTAKRNALLNALNIVIRQDCLQDEDGDARLEGGTVTSAQADELERRVKETNSDVTAFLKFAGAPKFSEIPSSKYAVLDEFLTKKERRGR